MASTLLEQFLARRTLPIGPPGSEILLVADHVYGHDRNTFKILRELEQTFGRRISDAQAAPRMRLFMDHYAPPPSVETAALHVQQRQIARECGAMLFEEGTGVGHHLGVEQFVDGGEVVVGVDSHTCTVGALGALGLRQPSVAVASCVLTGALRFDLPVPLRIELVGTLAPGATAHDVILHLARLGPDAFEDRLLEIGGPGLRGLGMPERLTLANLSVDLHARSVLLETDDTTRSYLCARGRGADFRPLQTELAAYDDAIVLDLSTVAPMVAVPPNLFTALPVAELPERVELNAVFAGTCSSGRLEDFVAFAAALGGHRASATRVVVTPPSAEVYRGLLSEGLLEALLALGATVNPPGCGPCMGLHQGLLYDGETGLITGSRNQPGRMGSPHARVFLAGPKVAGASAKAGFITAPAHPRTGG